MKAKRTKLKRSLGRATEIGAKAYLSTASKTGSHELAAASGSASAALTFGLEWIKAFLVEHNAERAERLIAGYLQAGGATEQSERLKTLLRLSGAKWGKESIREALKATLEALSDDVSPILGRLLEEYLARAEPPDWFFRGFARVLTDVSTSELTELRRLILLASHADQDREPAVCLVHLNIGTFGVSIQNRTVVSYDPPNPQLGIRLFRALVTNNLAIEFQDDSNMLSMSRVVVAQMQRLLAETSTDS